MNRLFLVVTCLAALAGCVDQNPSTDSVDQNSTTEDPPPGSGPYSTIWPVKWDPKVNWRTAAFWDLGLGLFPHPSSNMTYVVNVGVPAVRCPPVATTCTGATPGTKMVWLVSNERVYRTWEVDAGDMSLFNAMRDNAIEDVKTMAGGSAATWGIVTGTETKPPKGPGPHAWPVATVQKMYNGVIQFRGIGLGTIQDGQLQVPTVTTGG